MTVRVPVNLTKSIVFKYFALRPWSGCPERPRLRTWSPPGQPRAASRPLGPPTMKVMGTGTATATGNDAAALSERRPPRLVEPAGPLARPRAARRRHDPAAGLRRRAGRHRHRPARHLHPPGGRQHLGGDPRHRAAHSPTLGHPLADHRHLVRRLGRRHRGPDPPRTARPAAEGRPPDGGWPASPRSSSASCSTRCSVRRPVARPCRSFVRLRPALSRHPARHRHRGGAGRAALPEPADAPARRSAPWRWPPCARSSAPTACPSASWPRVIVGWGTAAACHLALGAPNGLPSAAEVTDAVRDLQVEVHGLRSTTAPGVGRGVVRRHRC